MGGELALADNPRGGSMFSFALALPAVESADRAPRGRANFKGGAR